jgi:hypothetical protein
VVAVIAADAGRYRDDPRADPRWLAQLDRIGADAPSATGASVLFRWMRQHRVEAVRALQLSADLLDLLRHLPTLDADLDAPDRWHTRSQTHAPGGGIDARVLERVRALLAKAESTTFAAEADAFTAKAQELMARHSIDQVLLGASADDGPTSVRLGIDDPYASAKFVLLDEVAEANRCRAVWNAGWGFATVMGYPTDIEVTEVLLTSLLVQATAAMMAAGRATADPRSRSRSFRQSFLVAFAVRIGQRLREASEGVVRAAETEHADSLLPVLARREAQLDEHVRRRCGELRSFTVKARDGSGRAAGWLAADLASLAVGEHLPEG